MIGLFSYLGGYEIPAAKLDAVKYSAYQLSNKAVKGLFCCPAIILELLRG